MSINFITDVVSLSYINADLHPPPYFKILISVCPSDILLAQKYTL